jgi:hypothetical protein
MTENKTKPTEASVAPYLAAIEDESRRADCAALSALMSRVTGAPPTMWGKSIVGFGSYHYRYDSGHEGDACLTGFASRKGDITLYLVASVLEQDAVLAKLGRHKLGKGCLYIRRLSDVALDVLEQLIIETVADLERRYVRT